MRKQQQRKSHAKPALIAVLILAVIGGGFLGIHQWERQLLARDAEAAASGVSHIPGKTIIQINDEEYAVKDHLDTYLLMGLDEVTETLSDPTLFTNNQQADFLLVLIVDHDAKTCTALHINRDTMAEIQQYGMKGVPLGTYLGQLALAHTYGSGGKDSCRNEVQAVSSFLLNVPIEHYASLTMDGIPVLNDMVGGVTVHIDDDFSQIDASLKQGTDVCLHGQQALTFVRARMNVADSSNLSRMGRQREYMNSLYLALQEKLSKNGNFSLELATKLGDYLVSDLTVSEMSDLAELLNAYEFCGIETIEGEAVVGKNYMEFYADEAALEDCVIRLFLKSAY